MATPLRPGRFSTTPAIVSGKQLHGFRRGIREGFTALSLTVTDPLAQVLG
jgi:hypothetical protein